MLGSPPQEGTRVKGEGGQFHDHPTANAGSILNRLSSNKGRQQAGQCGRYGLIQHFPADPHAKSVLNSQVTCVCVCVHVHACMHTLGDGGGHPSYCGSQARGKEDVYLPLATRFMNYCWPGVVGPPSSPGGRKNQYSHFAEQESTR